MSAIAAWNVGARCCECDAVADVQCDVHVGTSGPCRKACCPAHSADIGCGLHRCAGHERALSQAPKMRAESARRHEAMRAAKENKFVPLRTLQ